MNYPTLPKVLKADQLQLARWYRFLPSPGTCAIGLPEAHFRAKQQHELDIQTVIIERLNELGGITPTVSKIIGWDE